MDFDSYRNYCLGKPGATEDFPHGEVAAWYKVMGKMFSMTMIQPFQFNGEPAEPFKFINVKCDPEQALLLREKYPAVQPGWHQSKKHWNSIMMDNSVSDELLKSWIDHSYELVVNSLTKKQKEMLRNL